MYKEYEPEVLKKLQDTQIEILNDFTKICKKYNLNYFAIFGTAIGAVRHQGFIPWDDDLDVGMLRKDYEKFKEIMDFEMGDRYKLLTPEIDENYACSVIHLQKKGTKFISEYSKELKCDLCIDIDIFVFDNLADDLKKREKQLKETWFLGRLLFLCGTPKPFIPLKGLKCKIAKSICYISHYVLKMVGIKTGYVYKKLLESSQQYNGTQTEYVTCFEDPAAAKAKIKVNQIFPLKEIPFNNTTINIINGNHEVLTGIYGDYMKLPKEKDRINHAPYLISFGDEVNGK